MTRLLAPFVLGAALGAAGVWLTVDRASTGEPPTDPAASLAGSATVAPAPLGTDAHMELERVSVELELEREMRRVLAHEVEQLRARLAEGNGAGTPPAGGSDPAGGGALDRDSGRESAGDPSPSWFPGSALADLGMDEREVERVREIWDRYEMALIELQHRRSREGRALDKQALARDRLAIELRAQHELGDDAYDALLYATDRENRVLLRDVLETSPAAAAGLLSGDEVIEFDGRRIFRPRDLLRLTATGEKGEWVEVTVLRDGVLHRQHVQRGPLGVRLGTDKRSPLLE